MVDSSFLNYFKRATERYVILAQSYSSICPNLASGMDILLCLDYLSKIG
jgi:hypothetical protein